MTHQIYFKKNNDYYYYLYDSNINLTPILEINCDKSPFSINTIEIGPHLNLKTAFSTNVRMYL